MREVGISPVSHKGKPFYSLLLTRTFVLYSYYVLTLFFFSAALAINEALGEVEEIRKMKRARVGTDDRGMPTEPLFLRGCTTQLPEVEPIVAPAKLAAFKPT